MNILQLFSYIQSGLTDEVLYKQELSLRRGSILVSVLKASTSQPCNKVLSNLLDLFIIDWLDYVFFHNFN